MSLGYLATVDVGSEIYLRMPKLWRADISPIGSNPICCNSLLSINERNVSRTDFRMQVRVRACVVERRGDNDRNRCQRHMMPQQAAAQTS